MVPWVSCIVALHQFALFADCVRTSCVYVKIPHSIYFVATERFEISQFLSQGQSKLSVFSTSHYILLLIVVPQTMPGRGRYSIADKHKTIFTSRVFAQRLFLFPRISVGNIAII